MNLVISARATATTIEIDIHGHAGSHASGQKIQPLVNVHLSAEIPCHGERPAEILLEVTHRVTQWLMEEMPELPDAAIAADLL
jgi:hypothetical protein